MKLLELAGVKKFYDATQSQLVKLLSDLTPYKLSGRGASSYVFVKGDRAYKFWFADSAYEYFIHFVKKHKGNPALPKLYSDIKTIRTFFKRDARSTPDVIRYVIMERLMEVRDTSMIRLGTGLECEVSHLMWALDEHGGDKADVLNVLKHGDKTVTDPSVLSFIDTVFSFQKAVEGRAFWNDFHVGNVMWRGNQLVLIDPVANSGDLRINKIIKIANAGDPERMISGPKKRSES